MNPNKNYADPIKITFYFLPFSLVLGSLILNINIALLLIFSLKFFIEKKINLKFNFSDSILFLFFFTLILSSLINIKTISLENFIKSILVLKFFFMYFFLQKLIEVKKINLELFFKIIFFISLIISLDVIIQFYFGKNILGFTPHDGRITGMFRAEAIAGAFLQKLFIFSLIGCFLIFKNKNKINFPEILFYITVTFAIFVSSNRISFVLILFLLILLTIFFKVFRKNLLALVIFLIPLLFFTYKSNESIQVKIIDFQNNLKISASVFFQNENQNDNSYVSHGKLYLAAIETFKLNPVIGGGLKSFRFNCFILEEKKKFCSTHPHNYQLEILNYTGLIGFLLILIFSFNLIFLKIKTLKYKNLSYYDKIILSLLILNFCIEIFPLKSTGSLFTTWNGTLVWLAVALLNYKNYEINNKKIF